MRLLEQVFHVEHFSSAPGALMFPSSGDSPARVFHVEHSYGADLPKRKPLDPRFEEKIASLLSVQCSTWNNFHSTMHQTRALHSQERTNYSSQPDHHQQNYGTCHRSRQPEGRRR